MSDFCNPTTTLSVIVPIYNACEDLSRALDAILANEFQNFELILIDDGSTDGSSEICDQYVANFPHKIRVAHTPNRKLPAARNLGISMVRSKYFILLDADDWCEKELFAVLVNAIETTGAACACCGIHYIDEATGRVEDYTDSLFPQRLAGTVVDYRNCGAIMNAMLDCGTWNKVFRKSVVDDLQLHFEDGVKFGEDNRYWVQFLFSGAKIAIVKGRFYNYRINQKKATLSTSVRKNFDSFDETLRYIRQVMEKSGAYEEFCGEYQAYAVCQFLVALSLIAPMRRKAFILEWQQVFRECGHFAFSREQSGLFRAVMLYVHTTVCYLPTSMALVALLPYRILANPKAKNFLRRLTSKRPCQCAPS